MARSRKRKSTAQHLIGMAAVFLPAPVRQILGSRLGVPLTLLTLVLVSSGVVMVSWSDGRPKVEIDRERAQEVKERVVGRVESVRAYLENSKNESGQSTILGDLAGRLESSQQQAPLAPSGPLVPVSNPHQELPASPPPVAANPGHVIRIASFNIQVFGISKINKPGPMGVLADVVRRFDVVAIQEVRSIDESILPTFVSMINANGAYYDFAIGPRLGRTSSKEQYAIVYNTARIEIDRQSIYTVSDPQDFLHREPMVARFRVRGVPPNQAFTFSLVDIHTDPDDTKIELDALADVFVSVQRNGSGEDDVILLGDLNVDEYHFGRLGQLPNIAHAISGVTTNTRRNRMYDNIVFNRAATVEYTGRSGVLDLMAEYRLSEAQALEVSDHMPVWAEFSIYEGASPGPLVELPRTAPRY